LNLGHLYFDIVSNFVLRISYFASLGISTLVVSALQIHLFLQNEPNFPKSQMNVSNLLTADYDKMDTWSSGKNEPKTNPNEPNSKPIQTQYKPNTNPILAIQCGEAKMEYRQRALLKVQVLECRIGHYGEIFTG
jgi:hypothetical protein